MSSTTLSSASKRASQSWRRCSIQAASSSSPRRPSLHVVARDVWPSFSGTDEVVALLITRHAAGWRVTGEVLPDQFGVRAERFEAALDDAEAGALLRRVLDSDRPSLRWGL